MVDVQQLRATMDSDNDGLARGDWGGTPAIPASTVAATNESGRLAWVEVVAGTVTVVAIDGVTTGRVVGAFLVRPGSTITLTYSVAPTWKWFLL